jgi:hypothetical protein
VLDFCRKHGFDSNNHTGGRVKVTL